MLDRRKELKLAYKQQNPPPMGVYRIKNNSNGKILIGGSLNLTGSLNGHRFKLEFDSHHNKALKEDLNLYGADAFTFEILETLKSEEIPREDWRKAISALEEKWLNTLQPYGERGYNKQKKMK
ncbi:MAG: GIY-YIG nuclease family protein [Desulfocucumaceae bacterium]